MAENIFEELAEEAGKILGNPFGIRAKVEGCDFCFKDLKKEKIRKALQETVSFVMTDTEFKLKKFVFGNKETEDIHSLTSVLVRLTCAGLNSLYSENNEYEFVKHFLECKRCQEILLDTLGYFTGRLVMARKRRRRPLLVFFKNLFRQIFGLKERKHKPNPPTGIDAVSSIYLSLLVSFLGSKLFLNSEEKQEIFQRYVPLFYEKNIIPEEIYNILAQRTKEKKEDLTAEEFEKVLKDLVQ